MGQDPGRATPRVPLTRENDMMGRLPHGHSMNTTYLGNFVNHDPKFTS